MLDIGTWIHGPVAPDVIPRYLKTFSAWTWRNWSELTLLVNCLGRLHAFNKKRNDTQTADFGRCLHCKPKNNWLRLGVLVPTLFDGEKCKFPMLQLNLGGQICFIVPSVGWEPSHFVGIQPHSAFPMEVILANPPRWQLLLFFDSLPSLTFLGKSNTCHIQQLPNQCCSEASFHARPVFHPMVTLVSLPLRSGKLASINPSHDNQARQRDTWAASVDMCEIQPPWVFRSRLCPCGDFCWAATCSQTAHHGHQWPPKQLRNVEQRFYEHVGPWFLVLFPHVLRCTGLWASLSMLSHIDIS